MARITLGAGATDATVADYPPPVEVSGPSGSVESTTLEVEVSESSPEPVEVESVEVPAQEAPAAEPEESGDAEASEPDPAAEPEA